MCFGRNPEVMPGFVPFAFTDLVLQGLAVAAVAVPLHGVAYLVAAQEVSEDPQ